MKNKKLLLPIIILIVAVLLSAGYGVVAGMVKQPVTKEAEFPFSITYKYNSETVTINEKYVCEFSGASSHIIGQDNFWNAYIEGYSVGGKTGTAQKQENGTYLVNNYIMSFMSIIPSNDPEVPYIYVGAGVSFTNVTFTSETAFATLIHEAEITGS